MYFASAGIFWLCFISVFRCIEVVSSNTIADDLCGLEMDGLIRYYGYEAEIHEVVTEDGYILKLFRCNSRAPTLSRKKPVLLQHGILLSSDDFCINPPDLSLAYLLADAGYDVWLGNSRGNIYSRKHVYLDPNIPSSGFWNFSWYEMGIYDQPAQIDYILCETGNTKSLHYVGFSQGTTSMMVLLSEKPEYNSKICAASFLAPVGYRIETDLFFKILFSVPPILKPTLGFEIVPRSWFLSGLFKFACTYWPSICNSVINLIAGQSDNQRNNTILPAFTCHFPSGSSVKQFYHYAQEAEFRYFGTYIETNHIDDCPRFFPVERITAPLSLHYSTTDTFADALDVEALIPRLNSVVFIQRIEQQYNHIDFLWSMNSASLVYSNVLNILQQY